MLKHMHTHMTKTKSLNMQKKKKYVLVKCYMPKASGF